MFAHAHKIIQLWTINIENVQCNFSITFVFVTWKGENMHTSGAVSSYKVVSYVSGIRQKQDRHTRNIFQMPRWVLPGSFDFVVLCILSSFGQEFFIFSYYFFYFFNYLGIVFRFCNAPSNIFRLCFWKVVGNINYTYIYNNRSHSIIFVGRFFLSRFS